MKAKHKQLGLRAGATLGASALLFSAGALAADKELLDILLKNGAIDNKQYDALVKKESLSAKDVKDGHIGNSHVTLGDKGLEIESNDGNFKASIGGRLQLDGQTNWNSHNLAHATNGNTTNELADGTSLRRARIHVEGTFYKDYDYKFEYDFTRGNGTTAAGVTDAYIRWNSLKPFALTVGQFKEPFSLEEATSNRFLTFIERNMAVNAFSDNPNAYKIGIGASYAQDRWTAAGALQTEPVGGGWAYNTSVNGNGNANRNNGSGNTGWDVTGRVTGLPWYASKTEFVHVGASGSYRMVNNNYVGNNSGIQANSGTFFQAAIGNVDRTSVLGTGNLTTGPRSAPGSHEADHITRFGVESALVYGPFSLQGEYLRAGISGRGYNDEQLEGYYGYGSYFLTGESRNYKTKTGAWERITPNRNFDMNGGWGAWEVAAGYDYLNLTDGAIHGGRASTAKIGLNWYPNSHVRLMANYVHVLNIDTASVNTVGATTAPAANTAQARSRAFNNTNPDLLEFRAQVDF